MVLERAMSRIPAFSRDRLIAVVLPALVALVAAGEAAAAKLGGATWIYVAIAATGLLITITSLLLQQRQKETREHEDREGTFKEYLRWPLPRIADTKPNELGVQESEIARRLGGPGTPYATREIDVALDRALATKSVVIVVGESGAGKSRTAYEAACRNFNHDKVLVPKAAESLREALKSGLSSELGKGNILLWLDDLERYL